MIIGTVKEVKNGECRVALTPGNARILKDAGHEVWVEAGAGKLSGFTDAEYRKAGARLGDAKKVWSASDCVVKVKEPQKAEFKYFSAGKIVFSYLHLAACPEVARALMKSGMSAVAAETVQTKAGRLPLLEPMSELAGRMSMIIAAYHQATIHGGGGILIPGLPGVLPAKVVIVGGGTVGENAAKMASGMGAQVTIIDNRPERLRQLEEILPENVSTLISTPENISESILDADIIIGAVLIPGAKAPKLITKKMLSKIKKRAILIDVCIDQGGVSETSRPTTHSDPTYLIGNVLHYCVANMPGAYGHTATLAFTNSLVSYVAKLAQLGLTQMVKQDPGFATGLNIHAKSCVYKPVAEALGLPYSDPADFF